jgi:Fe-Mn family superoxide dismutase
LILPNLCLFQFDMFFETLNKITDKFELPPLNFTLDEGVPPILSPEQLQVHYLKVHRGYVNKLNMHILKTPYYKTPLQHIIRESAKDQKNILPIFNNAAQHFNHSLFWACLKPNKMEDKRGAERLMKQIDRDFGSFEKFKKMFIGRADSIFGSGWMFLVWNGIKLTLWEGINAKTPWMTAGLVPILCIDCWEHAYYIDYGPRRLDYLNDIWKVINWRFCGNLFDEILK